MTYIDGTDKVISLSKNMLSYIDQKLITTVGEHTLTIIYKGLTTTFTILIKQKPPISMSISTDEVVLFEGSTITLELDVSPNDATKEVFWQSEDPEVASITQEGKITGLKAGMAKVKAVSKVNDDVYATLEIPVWPKDGEKGPNMNNYEVIIMAPAYLLPEIDPFHPNYPYSDKEEKQLAWREVEDKYNATMSVVEIPSSEPSSSNEKIGWLINQAKNNNSIADIIVNPSSWIDELSKEGAIVDLSLYYTVYGRNYLDDAMKDAGSFQGGLYHLTDNSKGRVQLNHGLVFNLDLLNSLGLENPASLFNEGKWTWTDFLNYINLAASQLNDEYSVLSGKLVDLYLGIVNSADIKLVDYVNKELNFKNNYSMETINLINELYAIKNAWKETSSFNEGRAIFKVTKYDDIVKGLLESDISYGFVPFPYPDNLSKEDIKASYEVTNLSCQILSGRDYPEGIDERLIFRILNEMLIITRQKQTSNPEYIESELVKEVISSKISDEASIEAISFYTYDNLIYNWVYKYPIEDLSVMIDEVITLNKDYLEMLEKKEIEKFYFEKIK